MKIWDCVKVEHLQKDFSMLSSKKLLRILSFDYNFFTLEFLNDTLINQFGYIPDCEIDESDEYSKIEINLKNKTAKWIEIKGRYDENAIVLDWNQFLIDLQKMLNTAAAVSIEMI